MISKSPTQSVSLAGVADTFAQWRANRTRLGPTPQVLRRQAVALLDEHVAFHICQALQINGATLKQWNEQQHGADQSPATTTFSDCGQSSAPAFVELPANLPSTNTPDQGSANPLSTLKVQWPNGTRLSVTTELSTHELLRMLQSLPAPSTGESA